MPDNLLTKSVLIADHGLFMDLAPRLARDFGEVKLFIPWISGYPKAAPAFVGTGIRDVKRVQDFWPHVADADLVVFPDLYFADVAEVVRDRFDKPVWCHFGAERLELDRWGTRQLQRDLGIGSPRTRHFVGVDALAAHLQLVDDKWVKISCYRGDGETWHHETWHTTSILLDHFRNRVGALADQYEFIVEDHVDGIEVGYDGWTVKGDYPESAYWGFEVKDEGYVGKFSKYSDMPESIRDTNSKMSPILRDEKAVGFCSFESRLTAGGDSLMIDPCIRAGSPPFEGMMEGYENLAEIIWEGAHGRVAEAKSAGEYVAIAMMHSQFALTNWVPLEIPSSIERWVKLRNRAVIDGKVYHVPTEAGVPEIGAVVAVGDSLEEAVRLVFERAEKVRGYGVEIRVEALDAASAEIETAKDYGVEF